MIQRDEIIGKAVAMVNGFKEFRLASGQGEGVSEEFDLLVTGYIKDFRLIGETAVFFEGHAGTDRLLNAVHWAGGDLETAKMMLEGITE
jgi:hypothetical protein